MTEKNIEPNLETKATDGNPVFTPRQWLERFKQFTKREHKIDITPLLKGEDITDSGWGAKEQAIQENFFRGVGPEALFQITRAEYKTDPDSIKIKMYSGYTPNTTSRNETLTTIEEISFGQNSQKKKHRRILEKINRNRKRMQLRPYIGRRTAYLQIHDRNN